MEKHKDFPNFWSAVLILVLWEGLQIIFYMFAYDLGINYERGDPKAYAILVLSYGVVFSLLMSYKKIGYKELFNSTCNSTKKLILVLLLPIALTVGGGVFWIADITNLFLIYFPAGEDEYFLLSRMLGAGVVSVITVCLVAPVIEEMLFRGVILRSFLLNYSAPNAIILSSLLFAIFHLTISQLPAAFILGCLLGWLYLRTRSLWPSILAHFLNNSFAILLWSTQSSHEVQDSVTPEFNSVGVIILGLASSAVGVCMLYYILRARGIGAPDKRM